MATSARPWPSVAAAHVWAPLKLTLGESLLFDAEHNRLFFQDIFEHQLYQVDLTDDPDCKSPSRVPLADDLGMIALVAGDSQHLIASAKRGVALVCLKTGNLQYLCRYSAVELESGVRANDGCIDPRGRLWSGTHPDFIDPSTDGMDDFVTDSFHGAIYAYDYDLENGSLSNERVLIKFDRSLGVPDGSHIDADDTIAVAMAFGESNVLIVETGDRGSNSGNIVGQLDVDATMTTCVTYGGLDMKDMYITTAGVEKMIPGIQKNDKNFGAVFKARADVAGVARFKFGPLAPSVTRAATYTPLKHSEYKLGALGKASVPSAQ
ncbi:hypothetical protein RQP46_009468 [Phenoliferia psychrophenolica]